MLIARCVAAARNAWMAGASLLASGRVPKTQRTCWPAMCLAPQLGREGAERVADLPSGLVSQGYELAVRRAVFVPSAGDVPGEESPREACEPAYDDGQTEEKRQVGFRRSLRCGRRLDHRDDGG